ncbi:MAG: class I SAM-dependent methyltransferase [Methylocella sp.]
MTVFRQRAGQFLRAVSPSYRLKRKHEAELAYWRSELKHLMDWFQEGSRDWWGLPPPTPKQKLNVYELWTVNAVMTLHFMRPSYLEELRLDDRNYFAGKRVLEIGSGPLAPILQFTDCSRHCIDPLVNAYLAAGWPLFDYDAKFINIGGEALPYPDGYFEAIISVNALDHVDDFELVASEMQRVVRRGGGIYFEVEYHTPTVMEPITLNDSRVMKAFSGCELKMSINRTGQEMVEALEKRFDLLPIQFGWQGANRFVTWHGVRR